MIESKTRNSVMPEFLSLSQAPLWTVSPFLVVGHHFSLSHHPYKWFEDNEMIFFLLLTNLLSKLSRFFIALPLQDLCWIKRFAFFHLSRINFFIVRIFCVSFSRPCKMQIHWWWKKKNMFSLHRYPYWDK